MVCSINTTVHKHCKTIKHILIIEDSESFARHLKDKIDEHFSFNCDLAFNEQSARTMIRRKRYDLVIADIYLPDSTVGFIEEIVNQGHRIILMTGYDNDESRTNLLKLPIVDYVIKSDAVTLVNYLTKTIKRLNENRHTIVAVCDDSSLSRKQIVNLIELQNLAYIEFENGQEVLDAVDDGVHFDLLLTDYEMPKVNGLELIRRIRHTFLSEDLPIISISASEKIHLLAKFLKIGANDYLPKPFTDEEFLTRLNVTLDHLYIIRNYNRAIEELENISTQDFLTELYNRRYFHSIIKHITAEAARHQHPYAVLTVDIDHFKSINDTYGHYAGDVTIRHVAELLKQNARESDFCFRWGGEEFLILVPNAELEAVIQMSERLRTCIEASTIEIEGEEKALSVTVSIGGIVGFEKDPTVMIDKADKLLYEAKAAGRNRINVINAF